MLGNLFKYENDKLYKKNKRGKKWTCCNDLCIDRDGYIQVNVNNKMYKLHRLVYKFFHKDWDIDFEPYKNQIDHKDQDKLNNTIDNLKLVTISQNCQNKNTMYGEPIKGYCFNKSKRNKPWAAYWCVDGKQIRKSFKTEEEAKDYREKMVIECNYYRPCIEL